jgi:hypothetical protein
VTATGNRIKIRELTADLTITEEELRAVMGGTDKCYYLGKQFNTKDTWYCYNSDEKFWYLK